jgi:hypothetical protein
MLLSRQKLILTLLASFGGKSSATDFQKYLFLFTQLCEKEKSFDFVPYKFGCFSFQSMTDKRKLIEKGYLKDCNEWELASNLSISSIQCEKDKAEKISKFCLKFKTIKGKKLIQYVYKSYPYYAINSEIAAEHLTESELATISTARPVKKRTSTFSTIGYEGSSIEAYINKLIKNDIHILIDVRKNPISRKYGFSKNTLSSLLEKVGIEYMHMPSLGIESSERQELNSQSDYDLLFDRYETDVLKKETQSLNSLYAIFLDKKRVAITCFEKEHCQCHRSRVANSIKKISKDTIEIQHL